MKFGINDIVKKTSGYTFIGVVVSVFYTINNEVRYVVENTEQALHIYSAKQLELLEMDMDKFLGLKSAAKKLRDSYINEKHNDHS